MYCSCFVLCRDFDFLRFSPIQVTCPFLVAADSIIWKADDEKVSFPITILLGCPLRGWSFLDDLILSAERIWFLCEYLFLDVDKRSELGFILFLALGVHIGQCSSSFG